MARRLTFVQKRVYRADLRYSIETPSFPNLLGARPDRDTDERYVSVPLPVSAAGIANRAPGRRGYRTAQRTRCAYSATTESNWN